MPIQYITDASGKKIAVILPVEEYERLIHHSVKTESQVSEPDVSYKDNDMLTCEQEEELDRRYEYAVNNPDEGKTWDEVEKTVLSK